MLAPGTPIDIALLGAEPEYVEQFYGPLLGWHVRTGDTPDGSVVLDAEDVPLAAALPPVGPVTGWVVTLHAPDDVHRRLPDLGGRLLDVRGGVSYVADPSGAVFATAAAPTAVPLPPPGPGRAVWFENMTIDPVAADRFYGEAFGLAAQPTPGPDDYVLLATSAGPVAGRLALPPGLGRVLGARWMTYFAHPDVDRAARETVELGGTVVVPPRDTPTGRVTAIIDRQGAIATLLAR